MKNPFFATAILLMLLFSCSRVNPKYDIANFDSALEEINILGENAWVFVSDRHINNLAKQNQIQDFIRKQGGDYKFYFCDLSQEVNEHYKFYRILSIHRISESYSSHRHV